MEQLLAACGPTNQECYHEKLCDNRMVCPGWKTDIAQCTGKSKYPPLIQTDAIDDVELAMATRASKIGSASVDDEMDVDESAFGKCSS